MDPDSPWLEFFFNYFFYHWYPDITFGPGKTEYTKDDIFARRYLRQNSEFLPETLRTYVRSTLREPMTFWEVIDTVPGRGLLVRDLIIDRTIFVHDLTASECVSKWDIIFGFIGSADDLNLWTVIAPFSFPAVIKSDLLETIEDNFDRKTITPTALRDYSIEIMDIFLSFLFDLLNPEIPNIIDSDGEQMVLTTSNYSFLPRHRKSILSKLRTMRNFKENSGGEFTWKLEVNENEASIKGRIWVEKDSLITECTNTKRDRALKTRLLRNFPDILKYMDTQKISDIKKFMDKDPSQASEPPLNLEEFEPELRAAVEAKMESIHMAWTDLTVPALGGITPREAVKTKEGRQQVMELIREHENLDARNQNMPYRFDYNKLRRELGLSEE